MRKTKRARPSSHIRRVRTKKGIKKVRINKSIKKPKKVRRSRMMQLPQDVDDQIMQRLKEDDEWDNIINKVIDRLHGFETHKEINIMIKNEGGDELGIDASDVIEAVEGYD